MLTKADDYPIHQLPEPISNAGTDRNFYDRYFFNGYTRSGDVFFAAALGVYPHVNIMDASFCVVHKGVQHNIHASRYLVNMERMDTQVGPISVEVVEPLKSLRIKVDSNEQGIKAARGACVPSVRRMRSRRCRPFRSSSTGSGHP
mgnify:CR=1 FL=1